jgi:predicted membrane GTPase involved in stress response
MNNPITTSCIRSVLEKQIVRRIKRLIRVRSRMCLPKNAGRPRPSGRGGRPLTPPCQMSLEQALEFIREDE